MERKNYCFPFFWLRQGRRQELPGRIQEVYESGCRAFCVESRTHEDFCGPEWWKDLEVILEEAGKRGMKVWILDDRHFPTGYANGVLEEGGETTGSDRRWFLREHHVDVAGPARETAVLWPGLEPGENVLAAVAYRRAGRGEELSGRGIDLTANGEGGFLYWDVPEGYYRIFFLIRTFRGRLPEQAAYISGLTGSSVKRLIQAVYEPHYMHLSRYFGTVLEGFFSDEPGLYSQQTG
ncbi:MAG: glycosyl transferase family 2, partial [Lachnospiraceae bacterium]|nr:glycosyl transferase family 2 [Lachnospiraceae bacterium]